MSNVGVWTCLDGEPRAAVTTLAGVSWSATVSAFVVSYADLALNLAVELLGTDGAPTAPTQLLPLGYVPSVLDVAATPFGTAIAWDDSNNAGDVHYALVGVDGSLRHSNALAVNVSDVLGGAPVVLTLTWTGDSLTASGMQITPYWESCNVHCQVYRREALKCSPEAAICLRVSCPSTRTRRWAWWTSAPLTSPLLW